MITHTLRTEDVYPEDTYGSITVTENDDLEPYAVDIMIDTQDGDASIVLTVDQLRKLRHVLTDIEISARNR